MSPESANNISITRREFLGGAALCLGSLLLVDGAFSLYEDLKIMNRQQREAEREVIKKGTRQPDKNKLEAARDIIKWSTDNRRYVSPIELEQAKKVEAQEQLYQASASESLHRNREKEGPSDSKYWHDTAETGLGIAGLIVTAFLLFPIQSEDIELLRMKIRGK